MNELGTYVNESWPTGELVMANTWGPFAATQGTAVEIQGSSTLEIQGSPAEI